MRPPQQQQDLSQQQPGQSQQPGQLQQPGMQQQQPGMQQQQPGMQQPQLGPMQDPMLAQQQTQQTNLGFGQQPAPFNEPGMQFNDMNAMNQNKLMDPMLGPMDQQPLRDPVTGQQLRDPMTGQPIFGQQPKPGMDPMGQQQQMNKAPEQQFDPITGMPLSQQQIEMNKANQPMLGPSFDQMNQMMGPQDPMQFGAKPPFGEINNNLLIGDKMKQPGAQFQSGQPMDPLSMQNSQLYAMENGRLPLSLTSCLSAFRATRVSNASPRDRKP